MVHIEYNGWQQYTQQQTFHTTPPRGRGGGGVAVILLLLKHVEEKQHIGLLQREEKIRMMIRSNTPPTNWKLGPLSFNQHFIFLFPFFPSSLSTSHYCCSNSCPAITTQPTPPFLRLSYPAHPLTPTLSISSSYISALMVLLSTFIHLKWIPHSCEIHVFGCLETVMPLFHCLSCLMFCLVPCGFK